MRAELDAELVKDFPVLYRDRNAPMQQTCMCWGFDVGDGWHNILRELSQGIADAVSKHVYGAGSKAAALGGEDRAFECGFVVIVDQVKEKFGTLRFYWHTEPNETPRDSVDEDYAKEIYGQVSGMVDLAAGLSGVTCESCGSPGTMNDGGWLSVRCEPCREKEKR